MMHCSLAKFTMAQNSITIFSKLLVFEILLDVSETLQCSVSGLQVKIFMLDSLQLLTLLAGTLIHVKLKVIP
jgi:hypothetical protein